MEKIVPAALALLFSIALPLFSAAPVWNAATAPTLKAGNYDDLIINGRPVEVFQHGARPEWGYKQPQQDTFIVVHPKNARKNAPLYVVLHSAGHDVVSCLKCTRAAGNHAAIEKVNDLVSTFD